MNAKRMEIQKTLEWAELFDTAPRETKRMILASLIERVTVGARLQAARSMYNSSSPPGNSLSRRCRKRLPQLHG